MSDSGMVIPIGIAGLILGGAAFVVGQDTGLARGREDGRSTLAERVQAGYAKLDADLKRCEAGAGAASITYDTNRWPRCHAIGKEPSPMRLVETDAGIMYVCP